MILGGSILAGSGVLFATGLATARGADLSEVQRISLVELTWWTTAGLGISGATILGVGHGRHLGTRLRDVSVASSRDAKRPLRQTSPPTPPGPPHATAASLAEGPTPHAPGPLPGC